MYNTQNRSIRNASELLSNCKKGKWKFQTLSKPIRSECVLFFSKSNQIGRTGITFRQKLACFKEHLFFLDDEGLENIEVGDDDVLEDPKTATSSDVKKTRETDGGKSSRFFMRIWSWMQSKYKLGVHRDPNRSGCRNRLRSAEFHAKKVLNAKTDELVEHTPTRNRDKFSLVSTLRNISEYFIPL